MPKYTQTLTAGAYSLQDVSTRLKEAMDNLGWGTGKVDILGGYRFTATDETNSQVTPLVINKEDFTENISNKWTVYPARDRKELGVIAMYLPGVKSFRVKYVVRRYSGGSDNVLWPTGQDYSNWSNRFVATFVSTGTPSTSNTNTSQHNTKVIDLAPGTTNINTEYYTSWITGDIIGYPTIGISINDQDVYVEILAVEWTVDQHKFAFQSPNLDSPTFELSSRTYSGSTLVTLLSLPIKNSKSPLVRIGMFPTVNNNSFREAGLLLEAHSAILYNTHPNSMSVGMNLQKANYENIVWSSYSKDLTLMAGSNVSFDGFYLLSKQGETWSGTTWDTVNKESAFPNQSPQYPSLRKSVVPSYYTTSNNYQGTYSLSGDGWWVDRNITNYLYEIKNTATIESLQAYYNYYYVSSDSNYYHPVEFCLTRVNRVGDEYEVAEVVAQGKDLQKPIGTPVYSIPVNKELTPGLYMASFSSERRKYFYEVDVNVYSNYFSDSLGPSKSRDVQFLGNINRTPYSASTPPNRVRYIRETLKGSSVDKGNHWVEIQAFVGSTNVAQGKTVTASSTYTRNNGATIVDGQASNTESYAAVNLSPDGTSWVMVDLGGGYKVDTVKTWHYYGDSRSYNSKLEVSENGVDWTKVYEGSYPETPQGKTHNIGAISYITNALDIKTGVKYSYTLPIVDAANPLMTVRLVQSSSATPINLRTSFAENWYTYGKVSVFPPGIPILEKQNSYYGNNSGLLYSEALAFTKFNFGLDIQMSRWATQEYISGALPSSGFVRGDLRYLMYFDSRNDLEFGEGVSTFSDGRPYRKTWFTSVWGTALQANNLFLVNGSRPMNTSYTTPDGREYVTVITQSTYDRQSYAFRLR